MDTELAYCPTCRHQVRLAWTPAPTHEGHANIPDAPELVWRLPYKLDGIGFMKESRRFYPNKELGAHALGYVGLDNIGLEGLEAAYDKLVRGHEGKLIVQNDAQCESDGHYVTQHRKRAEKDQQPRRSV